MAACVVLLIAALIAASQPALADPSSLDAPVPQYLAFGFGPSPSDDIALSFQIGREFYPHVDWFDELDAVVDDRGNVSTANDLTEVVLITGARWMPFSKSPGTALQPAAVYLKAGFALEVQPIFISSPGFAFAAGYLPLQGARWAIGAEVRADLGLPSTSANGLTGVLVFELTN